MDTNIKKKIKAGIIGAAVGDALGFPVQFHKRGSFPEVTGMRAGNNMPAGTWSDDTSMMLHTAMSIAETGRVSPQDIADRFLDWFFDGELTPTGYAFDIGRTVAMALARYAQTGNVLRSGLRGEYDCGNGSLMRILPLAFTACSNEKIAMVSAITHAHDVPMRACILYIELCRRIIECNGNTSVRKELHRILHTPPYCNWDEWEYLNVLEHESVANIPSTGYVKDTLAAALWCVLNSSSYEETVLKAVNLGDDADSVGCVAGGLAGLLYGYGVPGGIPAEWHHQLRRVEIINHVVNTFSETAENSSGIIK